MKYHSFLTRKYLFSRLIALISVFAVAFAVFVLMVTLTVMEGFKVEMRERIRGTLSHLRVHSDSYYGMYGEDEAIEGLMKVPHVEAASPFVETLALFKSPYSLDVCEVRGIDPLREFEIGDFSEYLLHEHEWLQLATTESNLLPTDRVPYTKDEVAKLFSLEWRRFIAERVGFQGFERDNPPQPVVVGIQAVKRRIIQPYDVITLSCYSGIEYKPRQQSFLVVGVFQTGMFEHDLRKVYMPLRAAQRFLDLWDEDEDVEDYRISGISVRLDDYSHSAEVCADLEENVLPLLPGGLRLSVDTWEDQRRTLLRAVDIEKRIIYYILQLIVIFASGIIFVILWLLVIQKTRDLGVLAALGASPFGIVRVFTSLGMLLCVAGTIIGALAGWGFTANINEIHDAIRAKTGWSLFPPDIYYLTSIPIVYTARDLVVIFTPTLTFGFLGSVIPAVVAALRDPIRALRHE